MRIHLDPAAVEGGATPDLVNLVLAELDKRKAAPATSTEAKPAEAAKKPAEAEAAKKPAEAEPDVRAWLKDLEAKVAARDAGDRAKAETDERAKLKARVAELISKGDLKSVEEVMEKLEKGFTAKLDEKDGKYRLIETRLATAAKKGALVEALAGVEFISQTAARDAVAKFDSLFEVKLDAQGEAQVFEKGTNKPVSEAVKARLESGEFDHFLKSNSRKGGVGNGATSQSTAHGDAPRDIVDWVKQGVASQQAAAKAAGLSTRTSFL